ncbi:conserved protein of unknown function [Modestobacter italicus]|uniref:Uncharacterized protein n=1 Tax=Modestobacter italicus (strain DSM 44449 / CECT 9708 / BC 501) TaxID=2732864 RepID=I4F0M4_MODI5|nr:conserved protein of unknown function [Modestobacter marinus]
MRPPARAVLHRALWSATAAGVAAVLIGVFPGGSSAPGPTSPTTVQPVAAPAPLAVTQDTPVPSLAELAATAAARGANSPPSAGRGSHVRAWYLGFGAEGEGFPAVVLPEERLSEARADGGMTVTRVAADPDRPAEVRLSPDGPAPTDAEVRTVSAAELASYPEDQLPPPADPTALADHLAAVAAPAPADPAHLVDALERVLLRWSPGPAENAAIAGWLAQQPGWAVLGAVDDRLGRPGVAYTLDSRLDENSIATRRTVVLDPGTGTVLSIELSFLEDTGEWDVQPYAVMSYVAFGVG